MKIKKNTAILVLLAKCDWTRRSICSKHHGFIISNKTNNYLVKSKSIYQIQNQ